MKKKVFLLLFYLFGVSICWAYDKEHTLILTFVNQSSATLTYKGVTGVNPGNTFTVTPRKMAPGEAVTIIGESPQSNSLSGELHFEDESNQNNSLFIIDKIQWKPGQPLFDMSSSKFSSSVISKELNPEPNPVALMYIGAEIILKDKQP